MWIKLASFGPLAQLVEQETLNLFVASSTLAWFTKDRGISSAGRASDLHSEGQRFDPVILHQICPVSSEVELLLYTEIVGGSIPSLGTNLLS